MTFSTVLALPHLLKAFSFLCVAAFGMIALIHWRRAHINVPKAVGVVLDRKAAIEFSVGTLIGAATMLAIFGFEFLAGLLHVKTAVFVGHNILRSASSYLLSGFVEELLFRGLLLSGILLLVRQCWAAVALMAAVFGLSHVANPEVSSLSIFSNALGGVVYAIAYLLSKRLWLGTGIHFAWNFVQGPMLGFPVSGGTVLWGGLVAQSVTGPDWLTGGAYGPEGGLVSIFFRFVAAGLVVLWCAWVTPKPVAPRV